MKKIVLFDPSQGTRNLGDYIIRDSINREMKFLFENNIVARFSTHTPICKVLSVIKKGPIYKYCNECDYKFLCGTNLIKGSLLKVNSDWAIDFKAIPYYRNAISLGCGLGKNKKGFYDPYTITIYKKVLSKKYIHSARDEKTRQFFESLGLKAINTGCPTMWCLTPEHCNRIPTQKAKKAVFTLTDYSKNTVRDQKIIDTLLKNYKVIYYWPQGVGDIDYIKTLKRVSHIKILAPNLESYKKVLNEGDVDYVGTRLHGGIFAMQHFIRTIIIIIDNRARDIKETYGINAIEQEDIDNLDAMIKSSITTNVRINIEGINKFKKQFMKGK